MRRKTEQFFLPLVGQKKPQTENYLYNYNKMCVLCTRCQGTFNENRKWSEWCERKYTQAIQTHTENEIANNFSCTQFNDAIEYDTKQV